MKKQTKKQIQEQEEQENAIINNNIKEWQERRQQREQQEPRNATYYFELDKETISIRMQQKRHDELKEWADLLQAKRVFTYLNGCTLIYDL